ncbi:hypothetical protein KC332_g3702 [Hortaea werneckii]|nr:hypothetical protein KC358_g1784 [Hortaea werneckii]KAI6851628.1 hypothetical protein KC350_g1566 [Hortaea werneckii]KAI6942617.1 hypothetical protein KC341_g2098 [Hortaea werneckii]KAI6948384.1 hypothetical protein KC348_g1961 [Hortaea werneckii]KAI6979475.1 hypothetical protein KC321_g2332 [Hortaea werneckii]
MDQPSVLKFAFKTRAERDEIERRSKLFDGHPTEFNELAAFEKIDYAYSKACKVGQSPDLMDETTLIPLLKLDKAIESELSQLAHLNLSGVANLWQMCFLKVKGDHLPSPRPDFRFDPRRSHHQGPSSLGAAGDKMIEPDKGHQVTLHCIEAVPKSKPDGQDGTFVKAPKSKRKGDQDEAEVNEKGQGIDWPADPDLLAYPFFRNNSGALQMHYSAMNKPMKLINMPSPHALVPLLCENTLSSIEEWRTTWTY